MSKILKMNKCIMSNYGKTICKPCIEISMYLLDFFRTILSWIGPFLLTRGNMALLWMKDHLWPCCTAFSPQMSIHFRPLDDCSLVVQSDVFWQQDPLGIHLKIHERLRWIAWVKQPSWTSNHPPLLMHEKIIAFYSINTLRLLTQSIV